MNIISVIGFVAATLTTIAAVPQVVKIIKTRKTTDLSLLMYITMCSGVFLWLVYGLFINDYPLIIANAITFVLVSTVLIFKLKYK